jgi:hypothetical protein
MIGEVFAGNQAKIEHPLGGSVGTTAVPVATIARSRKLSPKRD